MRRIQQAPIGIALAVLTLTGCGSSERLERALSVDARHRRVVSLAPSLTETLFELGAGAQVVGVTNMCDRPAAARGRPAVGDSKHVSLESIAALEPHLILVNSEMLLESLAPLASRIDIQLVRTDNIGLVLDAVSTLGDAVGRQPRASELRARLESQLEQARRRAAKRPPTRVLFVVQHDPFYVAGPGSYVDELLTVLGYQNAAASLGEQWPCISEEALLTLSPDVIVDAALGLAESEQGIEATLLEYWQRFKTIPAVLAGRICMMADQVVVRPGPALGEALAVLERNIPGAPPPAEEPR